jgi:hypothetical protein
MVLPCSTKQCSWILMKQHFDLVENGHDNLQEPHFVGMSPSKSTGISR